MKGFFSILAVLICMALVSAPRASAHQRLIVLGGSDDIPAEASRQFVEWAQGDHAKILLIPWATEGTEYADVIKRQLRRRTPHGSFMLAPAFPMRGSDKQKFLKQLDQATGVYFTGGEQARILKTIQDPEIRSAIFRKFEGGTPFAGTSAGTAIMSKIAIIDEGDPKPDGSPNLIVDRGLCLLPENVIVDQHFIVRNREARLRLLVMANPGTIGIGIDEPAGFIVEDGIGRAVGPSNVVLIRGDGKSVKLSAGEQINLVDAH